MNPYNEVDNIMQNLMTVSYESGVTGKVTTAGTRIEPTSVPSLTSDDVGDLLQRVSHHFMLNILRVQIQIIRTTPYTD